eukprot:gene440-31459_t
MSVDTTWYHGRISRPDAEQRLIAHPPSKGLFLVRGSTRGDGGFVLSIWMGTAARHFQIRREVVNGGNALTFDTPSGSAPHFSSMYEIVNHMLQNSAVVPTPLTAWVPAPAGVEAEFDSMLTPENIYEEPVSIGVESNAYEEPVAIGVESNAGDDDYVNQSILDAYSELSVASGSSTSRTATAAGAVPGAAHHEQPVYATYAEGGRGSGEGIYAMSGGYAEAFSAGGYVNEGALAAAAAGAGAGAGGGSDGGGGGKEGKYMNQRAVNEMAKAMKAARSGAVAASARNGNDAGAAMPAKIPNKPGPKSAGGGDDDGSNYINQAAIDAHTKATPTADGGVRL